MPFSNASLAKLNGVDQALIDLIAQLEADFNAIGGDLTVPDYGGFRTYETQAQLVKWRDETVAAGGAYYAVAPAGQSSHETGRAVDVKVVTTPPGMSDPYRWLADRGRAIGLVAGFYFHGGPPAKGSDPFHFELPNSGGPFPVPSLPAGISASDIPPWRTGADDGSSGAGGPGSTPEVPTDGATSAPASSFSFLELDPGVAIGAAALLAAVVLMVLVRRQ
jgi:hypothetical protein